MYLKNINFCLEKNIGYQHFASNEKCILPIFNYVPLTLCDVERSFSKYKSILSDNRRNFKFDNLEKKF